MFLSFKELFLVKGLKNIENSGCGGVGKRGEGGGGGDRVHPKDMEWVELITEPMIVYGRNNIVFNYIVTNVINLHIL